MQVSEKSIEVSVKSISFFYCNYLYRYMLSFCSILHFILLRCVKKSTKSIYQKYQHRKIKIAKITNLLICGIVTNI